MRLKAQDAVTVESVLGKKSKKYTPIVKRKDRPDGIAWLIKYCPALTEIQICRLVGTTKGTIDSIKSKKHWNMQNIRPKHPVQIGLCSSEDLEKELMVAEAIEDSKKHN